ncbi:zinc ribbon domain-containing protein [Candidatus Halobeggiatoa sp. HSG11]|nr:zinc ribbon domain-containing protein [Candidatus Halobeggiatoa sp. HSG11]
MPIYEYACTKCEHKFETIQKMNDEPLVKCPDCGEDSLKKLVSAAAFHLKGSGWYKTDFADKKSDSPPAPPCGTGGCCPTCPTE